MSHLYFEKSPYFCIANHNSHEKIPENFHHHGFCRSSFVFLQNGNDNQIDDLLFQIQGRGKPDEKTLATLDSISRLKLNDEQSAHCCLLKIHAYWMMGKYDEPDTDTLIQIALDYYENSRDHYMKAKAYYEVFRLDYDKDNDIDPTHTDLL